MKRALSLNRIALTSPHINDTFSDACFCTIEFKTTCTFTAHCTLLSVFSRNGHRQEQWMLLATTTSLWSKYSLLPKQTHFQEFLLLCFFGRPSAVPTSRPLLQRRDRKREFPEKVRVAPARQNRC